MSLPHLAGEAIAALVDGELARGAHQRALDHLARCPECRAAVNAQRQAKSALVGAGIPTLPGDLLGRLASVPMTTDLGGPGTLAVAGDGELVWVPADPPGSASPTAPRRPRTDRRQRPTRPQSYPLSRARSVRLRRGLAGTLAGLAFGVVTAAAPVSSPGVSLRQPGVVDRGPQVVPAGVTLGPARSRGSERPVRPAGTDPTGSADTLSTVRIAQLGPR